MSVLSLILFVFAFVFFVIAASGSNIKTWQSGWLGAACAILGFILERVGTILR